MTHTWTGARGAAVWLKCTCAQLVHFFLAHAGLPHHQTKYEWAGSSVQLDQLNVVFFSHNSQIILSLRPFLHDTLSHNPHLTETWLAAYPGTWLAQSKLVNVQQCRTSSEHKIKDRAVRKQVMRHSRLNKVQTGEDKEAEGAFIWTCVGPICCAWSQTAFKQ